MFIRPKKIKKHTYAYLVKNKWTKKGPRQKVGKYLGRIHKIDRITEQDYLVKIDNKSAAEIIHSLLGWVLTDHGFTQYKHKWQQDNITVDTKKHMVHKNNQSIVLNINNDYLCTYTYRKLMRFKSAKDQKGVAVDLAKAFVGAGIPVPEEVFINVFQKIYKEGQSFI